MPNPRSFATAAVATLALAGAPAVARADMVAEVVTVDGVTYALASEYDDGGADRLVVDYDAAAGLLRFHSEYFDSNKVHAGPGCTATPGGFLPSVSCPVDVDAIVVDAGGGSDTVRLELRSPIVAVVDGGPGNDGLSASPSSGDAVVFLDGGPGDDVLRGGPGDDELDGGDGNDSLRGAGGADTLTGGPGFDDLSPPVSEHDYDRPDADVSVTLDGVANDGETGEGDNVTGIENLRVTGRHVTVTGTEGAERIAVTAASGSVAAGGGDDDITIRAGAGFTTSAGAGNDTVSVHGGGPTSGDAGDDKLTGHDGSETLLGGEGDDVLHGGFGADVLDGGPGRDEFVGDTTERGVVGTGNDRILARDGIAEPVDCGVGADIAVVDATDIVADTCEAVDLPPVAPPVVVLPESRDGATHRLTVPKPPKLGAFAKRGLVIRQACPAACTVTATLLVDKKTQKRLGTRTLARAKATRKAAGEAKLTLKPGKKLARKVQRLKTLTVTLQVKVAGTTTKRTLRLKR